MTLPNIYFENNNNKKKQRVCTFNFSQIDFFYNLSSFLSIDYMYIAY